LRIIPSPEEAVIASVAIRSPHNGSSYPRKRVSSTLCIIGSTTAASGILGAGIGNVLRHEYQRVDGQIIWKAVKDDLPPLKDALLEIKSSWKKTIGDRRVSA
jgi:hypothetical protein